MVSHWNRCTSETAYVSRAQDGQIDIVHFHSHHKIKEVYSTEVCSQVGGLVMEGVQGGFHTCSSTNRECKTRHVTMN